ncbi:MAG: FprA family A-type flavoprotein [Cellulosilyticaceae bacterium]
MNEQISIKPDFFWVGALDPDLRVFDIVMETEFGTTYNAYLLKGSEKTVLFETVKDKFFDKFIDQIKQITDPSKIDYIVVNHTEPDHVGSVAKILEYAPQATVIGTTSAIKYLSNIANRPFSSRIVKQGDTLSVGNKTIRFIMAQCLHWPDTMYSYIEEDKILVTCDSFGAHYCDSRVLRSSLNASQEADYLKAYEYYYTMIMGPFKPFVLQALNKIQDLEIDFICPGHGMVLDHTNIAYYKDLYKEWSTPVKRSCPSIVIPYVSAYGYTKKIAEEIQKGIVSTGKNVDVLLFDLVTSDMDAVLREVSMCTGLLVGSPTIVADTLPPIWTLLTSLNPTIHKGIKAGCFGSYGWSGEATNNIAERFKQLRFSMPLEPLKILFNPNNEERLSAFEYGVNFAEEILG